MERLIVSLASLSFAILLLYEGKRDRLIHAFVLVCLAVFVQKTSLILNGIFPGTAWEAAWAAGTLVLPPLWLLLTRIFLKGRTFLSPREIILSAGISVFLLLFLVLPQSRWSLLFLVYEGYGGTVILLCLGALFAFVRGDIPPMEKRKAGYILTVATVTLLLTMIDVGFFRGRPDVLHLSDLMQAVFLYLGYLSIRHPGLPALNEAILRVFYSFGLMIFVMAAYYGLTFLSESRSVLPFPGVFALAWIVVVFMNPVRGLLRRLLRRFFPAGKRIFQSFRMEDIERERALLLEEMATGLAHEIRNPLGSIKGAAEYLRLDAATVENRKLLDVIIEETNRLNTVVSQFLNYARPHSGQPEKQNLNGIIEKVVSLLKTMGLPGGISIRTELDAGIPPVRVDGEQMIQVLLNLGLNALDAMPRGGLLTFSSGRFRTGKKESVELVVRDTGEGIPEEAMADIFKPFFTTKRKGTGLGLSICERIVRNNGGEILVETERGKGTAFRIRL